ncbi:bifunctional phosphopantothenoylcysteine decarboxylase/phosphopantothenate--cysteine ligase CoaBC [Sneathia sp. DSM 16631]|uniref:bifunctional phosphopantothenoylcysteine decarboxylase/phosphopantothenate--cysteine ligase CoaBC n=1 Tax=Sneathia sp. DSM 16631 TaxID=2777994 RepID=UPI0018661CD8|nr:bifunctional phosphopantothenoylcysteine decarboxylase/phosphopantothenate--cysteine ligase CoaBC [Sneathia sp. DSM 16631]MBE3031462.1 bifunctional phosphopantothenoylcysteine decarboxylase/phosphopantothenate--cysteine ligase CoaBC [Sneathia sp. DSM 16631]
MKMVLIIVSSSIACYKAVDVCSSLKKLGYNVKVIMTKNATKMISPLIFETLTKNKVYVDMFCDKDSNYVSHIQLVKEASKVIVLPATANLIAKMANGIADDFASTALLVAKPKDIMVFPAMNTNMYENCITQKNISTLRNYGMSIIEPVTGHLACDDIGKGKLPSVDFVLDNIVFFLEKTNEYMNKNILITAGGTREKIDPVRYITNNSSGKMGYSLAKMASLMGANVTLVSTRRNLKLPVNLKEVIYCDSAQEMYDIVMSKKNNMDYIIKCAAVSDFKVKNVCDKKIKKDDMKEFKIDLELNKDILLELSKTENRHFTLVGFAAESNNIMENAKKKLKKKNLDYLILNDISDKSIGFNSDYNEVYVLSKNDEVKKIQKDTKDNIAKKILESIKENNYE